MYIYGLRGNYSAAIKEMDIKMVEAQGKSKDEESIELLHEDLFDVGSQLRQGWGLSTGLNFNNSVCLQPQMRLQLVPSLLILEQVSRREALTRFESAAFELDY
jgi:hypothetical protein